MEDLGVQVKEQDHMYMSMLIRFSRKGDGISVGVVLAKVPTLGQSDITFECQSVRTA